LDLFCQLLSHDTLQGNKRVPVLLKKNLPASAGYLAVLSAL
jgi:hypothetical protein